MASHRKPPRRPMKRRPKPAIASKSAFTPPAPLLEIVKGAGDFMALASSHGHLMFLNPAGRKLAGLTMTEDIQGTLLTDYFPSRAATGNGKNILAQAARAGAWTSASVLLRKDLRKVNVIQTIIAHKNRKGRVSGYSVIARDLSKPLQLEAQLRAARTLAKRHDQLADLAHEAIIVRDLNGTITYWNEGAARKYGYSKQEAIGKNIHELLRPQFPVSREQTELDLQARGYWEGELIHARRGGGEIIVASRQVVAPESGDEPAVILEINRNISDRKQIEQKLRESEQLLRQLSSYLLQSQDEERRRISRELQDSLSPSLTGILSRLHSINKLSDALDEPGARALDESLELAEFADNFIRQFSSTLHPRVLDEKGLEAAVRWYVDSIAVPGRGRLEVESRPFLPRLPHNAERSLYRIVQEAVARLRLRSDHSVVKIRLDLTRREFLLEIRDESGEAPGAAWENAEAPSRVLENAIAGMRERIELVGGRLEIGSGHTDPLLRAILPLEIVSSGTRAESGP